MKLSDRIYNDSDAALWVIDEIVKLEGEVERLRAYIREREILHAQSLDAAQAEVERLRLYESMASEYGLSVFEDLQELKSELEQLRYGHETEIERLRASCDDYASHKQRQDERIIELQAEIARLRAALAEADEPVAWLDKSSGDVLVCPLEASKKKGLIPLYPHPPSREPVAWFESPYGEVRVNPLYKFQFPSSLLWWQIPLYTHPPRREPLTEDEIIKLGVCNGVLPLLHDDTHDELVRIARWVERAHGIGTDE